MVFCPLAKTANKPHNKQTDKEEKCEVGEKPEGDLPVRRANRKLCSAVNNAEREAVGENLVRIKNSEIVLADDNESRHQC